MSGGRLIAVAAEDGRGLDAVVSRYPGDCPFWVLAEADGRELTGSLVVINPCCGANEPRVMVRFLRGIGVDVVIAGGMGSRAMKMLQSFDIGVVTGEIGTVGSALGAYLRGEHAGEASPPGGHRGDRRAHARQMASRPWAELQ